MNSTTNPRTGATLNPADLLDVVLIDAAKCARIGDMSVSWWHAEVAAGRGPAPAIRRPRCTRWRAVDVRAFWERFADEAGPDSVAAAGVVALAKRASKAAGAAKTAK